MIACYKFYRKKQGSYKKSFFANLHRLKIALPKGPSINDVSPNFRFLGYPPSPCLLKSTSKRLLFWAFFVPPYLPLWGDVVYGWFLRIPLVEVGSSLF